MVLTKSVTDVLNGTIESVRTIIPFQVDVNKPKLYTTSFQQQAITVLIGMTGDIKGKVLIDGTEDLFGKLSKEMFGFLPEGDMFTSFVGELGNMIAGGLATSISKKGVSIDITPPTVLVGQMEVYGFDKAFRLPLNIQNLGPMDVFVLIDKL